MILIGFFVLVTLGVSIALFSFYWTKEIRNEQVYIDILADARAGYIIQREDMGMEIKKMGFLTGKYGGICALNEKNKYGCNDLHYNKESDIKDMKSSNLKCQPVIVRSISGEIRQFKVYSVMEIGNFAGKSKKFGRGKRYSDIYIGLTLPPREANSSKRLNYNIQKEEMCGSLFVYSVHVVGQ